MKELTAPGSPISLTFPNEFIKRKITIQAEDPLKPPARPTEEMLRHLNRIGNEYPFCVYYKQKVNDPL
jgi:hypothetical protein